MRNANALPVLASLTSKWRLPKASNLKYRNVPTVIDNIRFDSRSEAARYQELILLQHAGEIADLTVHPVYELEPKITLPNGVKLKAIRYEADFSYIEVKRKLVVVEDVKGFETPEFKLKANLFLRRYPTVDFRIVK